jgi:hypothetical protein
VLFAQILDAFEHSHAPRLRNHISDHEYLHNVELGEETVVSLICERSFLGRTRLACTERETRKRAMQARRLRSQECLSRCGRVIILTLSEWTNFQVSF